MTQLQYFIHKILQSKYLFLINMFMLVILYISCYSSQIVYCMMTDDSETTKHVLLTQKLSNLKANIDSPYNRVLIGGGITRGTFLTNAIRFSLLSFGITQQTIAAPLDALNLTETYGDTFIIKHPKTISNLLTETINELVNHNKQKQFYGDIDIEQFKQTCLQKQETFNERCTILENFIDWKLTQYQQKVNQLQSKELLLVSTLLNNQTHISENINTIINDFNHNYIRETLKHNTEHQNLLNRLNILMQEKHILELRNNDLQEQINKSERVITSQLTEINQKLRDLESQGKTTLALISTSPK